MAINHRILSGITSSAQGLISGLSVGFFGPAAFPFLAATIPLDLRAVTKWQTLSKTPSPKTRANLIGSSIGSMCINALFSFAGISVMTPISPMGTATRQQFYQIIATPVTAQNGEELTKKAKQLIDTQQSHWLTREQIDKLQEKTRTVISVKSSTTADKKLYDEGYSIISEAVTAANFTNILDRTSAISKNSRAEIVLPSIVKSKIAQKAKQAFAIAEAKEKERISKLPKKYNATMTNCFVDAPCESFERIAVFEDGKVTVGDLNCPIAGQESCSVEMADSRPVSMREWDPADGFVLTRVTIRDQVKEGTYDPEMEANPYVKLQSERVGQILQEWEREKENAKKNCKGLHGSAWTACAGAQSGN